MTVRLERGKWVNGANPSGSPRQGATLSDYVSAGLIARGPPLRPVREARKGCERSTGKGRALPAKVMIYYVFAQTLFPLVSAREVLRCGRVAVGTLGHGLVGSVHGGGLTGAHAAGDSTARAAALDPAIALAVERWQLVYSQC